MKTQTFTENTRLNDWVRDDFQRAAILEEYGLDSCCGGQQTLAEACRKKGLDPSEVMARLQGSAGAPPVFEETGWTRAPLEALVDHIVEKHHAYLKAALPQITEWIDKVAAAHGARHPELRELAARFAELRAELDPHMMKEEHVLFPMIRQAAQGGEPAGFECGGIDRPIAVMRHEHEHAGGLLASLREITGGYQVPDDGCASYRALMDELRRFEEDTHRHIDLENGILFPRVQGQAVAH